MLSERNTTNELYASDSINNMTIPINTMQFTKKGLIYSWNPYLNIKKTAVANNDRNNVLNILMSFQGHDYD